jgi:hypothetical protein
MSKTLITVLIYCNMTVETRIMECEETPVARQQHSNHLSVATNVHATTEKQLGHCQSTAAITVGDTVRNSVFYVACAKVII